MGIDQFVEKLGVSLLPYQKDMLRMISKSDKIFIYMPPKMGYTHAKILARSIGILLESV